jgi:isochorismate synthase EntC
VRYRINDAKDEEEKWSPAADKASASIPKDWLKKIVRAQTVDITVADEHGSQIVMKFDMPDPVSVEAACNVDEREK